MREYQPFPISNFRTGFDEAIEPWLIPKDAYQSLINAHLYRGIVEKIGGYTLFANFTYRNILSLGTPDGLTATYTGTLPSLPVTSNFFAYGTIVAGVSAEEFGYTSDASSTVVNLTGNAGGTGTVDITTGAYSITFNTPPPMDTYSCVFIVWDSAPTTTTAIMGIKPYYQIGGGQDVLVFDQKRVGKIVSNFGTLSSQAGALQAVSELPHDYYQSKIITGNGSTKTYTGTLTGAPFVPGTLVWTEFDSTGLAVDVVVAGITYPMVIKDNGVGKLEGPPTTPPTVTSGEINYVTGDYTITFAANVPSMNYYDSTTGLYGTIFTGSISNFFSLSNYQFFAFFCNNVDPIFYYDGISVHYLTTNLLVTPIASTGGIPLLGAGGYDITRCLHIFTNRSRLLLISPTVDNVPATNTIFWSKPFDPLNFTNDEQEQADTSEPIRAIGFINSDLVVRFANSERIFRYTDDAFAPFRFDSTNNVWACDAPYSSINYDSWFSSVGRPAIVGSDAVNVRRADEIIPDFTDPYRINEQTPVPFMSQTSIQQCYGERFDDLKEGWLCYNSAPQDQNGPTASDNVLAFNYLDSTYAVYSFPFSCLGLGRIINVPTWGTTYTLWEDANYNWDSYQAQGNALIDLAGDQFDKVYQLNDGNTMGDGQTPVLMSAITKSFNPFIEQGQLCRFGFVDLFVSANELTNLRVQFYLNDELYVDSNGQPAGFFQETTLTFLPRDAMSPTNDQIKVWKRIYVGSVGKEFTIRFYQNIDDFPPNNPPASLDQSVYIHAMVLYMKPAGRIFN